LRFNLITLCSELSNLRLGLITLCQELILTGLQLGHLLTELMLNSRGGPCKVRSPPADQGQKAQGKGKVPVKGHLPCRARLTHVHSPV
jgi:hypothetical protein